MKDFCISVIKELSSCNPKDYGMIFVNRKMEFHRRFSNGLITSTNHGTEFFHNVINCLDGHLKWIERGEYGDNFRKLVKQA